MTFGIQFEHLAKSNFHLINIWRSKLLLDLNQQPFTSSPYDNRQIAEQ